MRRTLDKTTFKILIEQVFKVFKQVVNQYKQEIFNVDTIYFKSV